MNVLWDEWVYVIEHVLVSMLERQKKIIIKVCDFSYITIPNKPLVSLQAPWHEGCLQALIVHNLLSPHNYKRNRGKDVNPCKTRKCGYKKTLEQTSHFVMLVKIYFACLK